jgi:hypothetical protein
VIDPGSGAAVAVSRRLPFERWSKLPPFLDVPFWDEDGVVGIVNGFLRNWWVLVVCVYSADTGPVIVAAKEIGSSHTAEISIISHRFH